MKHDPVITLTTDFGYKDPFVGIMKGVILKINPHMKIIDIAHEIEPQNIVEASFLIEKFFLYFPQRTIHIVVVDPGVGSERRPIIVSAENHYFVGPDNGVFSRIYKSSNTCSVVHVTAEHYFMPEKSSTFHGRDIFAPVAAWLSKGVNFQNFGDLIRDYVTFSLPIATKPEDNVLEGEVIYIDHFGNVITNISAEKLDDLLRSIQDADMRITIQDREAPLKRHYSEADDEMLYSLIDSFGYLEIFVNKGNASKMFGIKIGEKVKIKVI